MIRPDFQPQRLKGESRAKYVKRRATVNRAIKTYLRGRLAYTSSRCVVLPMRAVDLSVDAQIEQGKLRDVKIVHPPVALPWPFGPKKPKPAGKQFRVGRTKGVPARRYPAGRDRREWREMHRQNPQLRADGYLQ